MFFLISYITIEYYADSSVKSYKTITIDKGESFRSISYKFERDSVINSPLLFKLFSKWQKYDKQIRFGEFNIPVGLNEYDLVKELKELKQIEYKVTIIEGERYKNIVPIFVKTLKLDSQKLVSLYTDPFFLKELNITAKNLEGYIFPQTYYFSRGVSERNLLSQLVKKTQNLLADTSNADNKHKLSFYQTLILASIVQAECIYEDEMPLVASVYLNRLRIGMKLQADPTIQFFQKKPIRLLNKHLRMPHPYNTYLNYGLTPGPINNPGEAAIKAVQSPAKSKYLYFVADGTNGRHIFGRNLIEHNQNRKKLDSIRRALRRKQRGR